jgi:hypothetical protein
MAARIVEAEELQKILDEQRLCLVGNESSGVKIVRAESNTTLPPLTIARAFEILGKNRCFIYIDERLNLFIRR